MPKTITVQDWQNRRENQSKGDVLPTGGIWCNECDNNPHECVCEWEEENGKMVNVSAKKE